MEEITVQDVRNALLKVVPNSKYVANLDDEKLFKCNTSRDLHVLSVQVGSIIKQIGKEKHLSLPHELHKVLPNNTVKAIVETINLCIQEEEKLGISVKK